MASNIRPAGVFDTTYEQDIALNRTFGEKLFAYGGLAVLLFVPALVPGTLREGFERIRALASPLARAMKTKIVVTEVHPFLDGNGRTGRLAMNCVLSEAGLGRIMIPTVYREDYLSCILLNGNRQQQFCFYHRTIYLFYFKPGFFTVQ